MKITVKNYQHATNTYDVEGYMDNKPFVEGKLYVGGRWGDDRVEIIKFVGWENEKPVWETIDEGWDMFDEEDTNA